MRSPSHGGTRPPCSGRSALPLRLVIWNSGSCRIIAKCGGIGFANEGPGHAAEPFFEGNRGASFDTETTTVDGVTTQMGGAEGRARRGDFTVKIAGIEAAN